MNSNTRFDWNYILTNQDEGIVKIGIRIFSDLGPRDLRNLQEINCAFRNFIDKEEVKIKQRLYRAVFTFPSTYWNRLKWRDGYKSKTVKYLQEDYDVDIKVFYFGPKRIAAVSGEIQNVARCGYELDVDWCGKNGDVFHKIREDVKKKEIAIEEEKEMNENKIFLRCVLPLWSEEK